MSLHLDEHKRKAVLGITVGLAIASLTAFKCHQAWIPDKGTPWGLLILAALPWIGWGCSHLALERGYPTSAAHSLVVVGLLVAVLIGASQLPGTIGLAFVFVAVMPPVMLLSLPVRFGAMRRGYKG